LFTLFNYNSKISKIKHFRKSFDFLLRVIDYFQFICYNFTMIHGILTSEQCAECKGCCVFDKNDVWELPASVTAAQKPGSDLLVCGFLTQNGCGLKSRKPLECALYPFRIMRLGEYMVIALCKYCKAVAELPLNRLTRFTQRKYGEFADLAKKHPEIVKEYNSEYIILKVIEYDESQ
jgi:hypothetical protein